MTKISRIVSVGVFTGKKNTFLLSRYWVFARINLR